VGKREKSGPISVKIIWAVSVLMPGTCVRSTPKERYPSLLNYGPEYVQTQWAYLVERNRADVGGRDDSLRPDGAAQYAGLLWRRLLLLGVGGVSGYCNCVSWRNPRLV
jgi:hypothetical protein